jgi:Ca2+:H+ antiporter
MSSHVSTPVQQNRLLSLRREWPLLLSLVTTALFQFFGSQWLADLSQPAWFAFMLLWLLVVILLSAFAIVRHAESLAVLLGEPLGTLVLTLSVIGIEVMMISAVMLTGSGKPEMARNTMFAVVMIVLNGMVGLSLLMGGLRHHEQDYNLQGANAFLALILPLAVLGLVLPNVTTSSPGPTLSSFQAIFLGVISIGLYAVFLAVQNRRHRAYFIADPVHGSGDGTDSLAGDMAHHADLDVQSIPFHGILLGAYLLPLVILAKQLAVPLDHGVRVLGAPVALSGFIVAALILSPESLTATRAALANELQRSVNILLGSVLATIGLTIPAVVTIGLVTNRAIILGLNAVDTVLLLLTLAVSMITFSSPRTNMLLGAVHLLMFLAYVMLIFAS